MKDSASPASQAPQIIEEKVDDQLQTFEFPSDLPEDQELEGISTLRNENESDITFVGNDILLTTLSRPKED